MDNLLKIGLLLQIPNALILLVLAITFLLPYLTLALIFWAIMGALYALLNIISIILIIIGIGK